MKKTASMVEEFSLVMPRAKLSNPLAPHRPVIWCDAGCLQCLPKLLTCSYRKGTWTVRLRNLSSCDWIPLFTLQTGDLPTRTTSQARNPANPDQVPYILRIRGAKDLPSVGSGLEVCECLEMSESWTWMLESNQSNHLSIAQSVDNDNDSKEVCVVEGRVYKAYVFQSKAK